MWALLLGSMMVLMVSGDTHVTHVSATLGDTVLLPCNCSGGSLKEFKWQKEDPGKLIYHDGFKPNFEDRAKIFVDKDSSDCSLQLTNITADDQGTYRCAFHIQELYNRRFIELNISANYHVCQKKLNGDASEGVFECEVEGRYREAKIQWFLEGKLLTNSPTVIIHTHPVAPDASGSYRFKSKLITPFSLTSEPKCDVKTEGISPNVSDFCEVRSGHLKEHPPQYSMLWFTIIPVVLVLFILVLWCRRHHNQQEMKCHASFARLDLQSVNLQGVEIDNC
ncbi:uncharacterized protein LOC131446388 [Solea solea]|uniref:uncharacterized protein LOC131446388 n=1 Tax=Solea solea TaxID=90069 RepID=UPI00272991B9|nr:uncharacterized protein LOC131446388 [Solea solea]